MEAYITEDKEVKIRCRVDKETWFGEKVVEAETAACRGDSKTLSGSGRSIFKNSPRLRIKDAVRKPLKTQE